MTEHTLDARGFICPLPVLKARKKLLGMRNGDILRVLVTDTNAPKDFELFCQENNYIFLSAKEQNNATEVVVQKA